LNRTTAAVIQQEFTQIEVKAGYANDTGNNVGRIFKGSIVNIRTGRESTTDTFLDIYCADGDIGYNWSVLNQTLAAGHTQEDIHKTIADAFALYDVSQGYTAPVPQFRMPRGVAMFGMARDYAENWARSNGVTWSIKDQTFETVPFHGVLPDEVIVLSRTTGLIGMPQQTFGGVVGRCLLNPSVRQNQRIQLEKDSIQRADYNPASVDAGQLAFRRLAESISHTDGVYRVLKVDHLGDTRGNDWYTEFWCIAVDGTMPLGDSVLEMQGGPESVSPYD
jgi:hypothetical protein